MLREMKGNSKEGMTVAEIVCILNLNGRALGGIGRQGRSFPATL